MSMIFRKTPLAVAISLALAGSQVLIAGEAKGDSLEEVTVTGSRIKQAVGMDTPTPVASLSATEIAAMAPGNLTEAMAQLPQFYGGATAENFNTGGFFNSPGGGSLDLRGIGSKRTLTLLDGRRVVPATVYGGPDINMFPSQMLKSIETVTGGASAAYGTDAVSGVINYILDTRFDGFRASGQMGQTQRGDNDNSRFSFAMGHAITEKLHVLFSAGHDEAEEVLGYEGRDWYQGCGLINNPVLATNAANNLTSQSTPRLIPACNLYSTQLSFDGIINPAGTGALGRLQFNADGTVSPFTPGSIIAGGGSLQSGGSGDDFTKDRRSLVSGQKRNNAFLYVDYDVADNLNVYAQGMYGDQQLRYTAAVGSFQFQPITIYRDNAFLPASLGTAMDAAGLTSFVFGRQGHSDDISQYGAFANTNRTVSGTVGFKSTVAADGFFNGWNIDGYYQYGKNQLDAVQEGGVRVDRIFHAVDAVRDPVTGAIRCRVTQISGRLPDCVPLNLFGRGNASQASIDWVTGFDPGVAVATQAWYGPNERSPYSYVGDEDKHRLVELKQQVFEATASGEVAEGWAGPISAAVGVNYRKESVDQKVRASQGNPAADPFFYPAWCNDGATAAQCVAQIASGYRPPGNIGVRGLPNNVQTNSVEFQFSKVPFIRGSYDIKEVFAESVVPLVKDFPLLQALNFQGAVRWADYAGSGQIWSYKGGLDAEITDELRLRGTYSRDVRAANIGERFDRTGGLAPNLRDQLLNNNYDVTIIQGGNPEVDPEVADTFTAGIVYRPNWLAGLNLSIDWLSVSLEDAIEQLTAQNIVDACYLRNDVDQCSRIERDPAPGGRIQFVNQVFQNLTKSKIEGIDVEIGYSHAVTLLGGGERLGVRLFGSFLRENSRTNTAGVKTENVGSVAAQLFEMKATAAFTYSRGDFNWNLSARYNDGGLLNISYNLPDTSGVTNWNVADNTIGSSVYWDTRMAYSMALGDGNIELFANVNNLFDRPPTFLFAANAAGQTGGGYDILGRRFTVGANIRF
jgi:iron complex outermembrane recepter protein